MTHNSFNLDDFVDAATGKPAREVIDGPGRYELSPSSDVGESDSPSPAEMLSRLMHTSHDPTELSVTLPVKKLMEVLVEIGNVQRKGLANGFDAAEKTRELVMLRAQLSACEEALEARNVIVGRVWTLLENESPCGEDLRAEDVRDALGNRPEADAQSVLGVEAGDPDLIARVPTTEELKADQG